MWSFHMIGDAPLRLGIGSFHAMFSDTDHVVGSPFSLLTPFADGPRHAGQLSADAETVTTARVTTARENRMRVDTANPPDRYPRSGPRVAMSARQRAVETPAR